MTQLRVEETRMFEIPADTKGETNQFRSQKHHVNLVGECLNGGGGLRMWNTNLFGMWIFCHLPKRMGKDLKYMISILMY